MSNSIQKEKLNKKLSSTSIQTSVTIKESEELSEIFLEKFIAMNPLYLIDGDEDQDEQSYQTSSSSLKSDYKNKSQFSSDI